MENQNEHKVYEINEKPYSRNDIVEMIKRMSTLEDDPAKPKEKNAE